MYNNAINWVMATHDSITVNEVTSQMVRQANDEMLILSLFFIIIVGAIYFIFFKDKKEK